MHWHGGQCLRWLVPNYAVVFRLAGYLLLLFFVRNRMNCYIHYDIQVFLNRMNYYIIMIKYSFIIISRTFRLMSRVFANGLRDRRSIPGQVIPKTQKMAFDAALFNTQHYKIRIEGTVERSREWSSALPYTPV